MKIIQDIWIIQENGIVLFSRVFHEQIHEQLFGALMSALSTFADQISEHGLKSLDLNNKRFTLKRKKGLLFICNSSRKVKEKKVQQELDKLAENFLIKYPNAPVDQEGDISIYSGFKTEIENILEDPIKKFWNDF
ncbi:MAG: hypothetical protein EU550_00090 [Promethearchaeota archaeon]|nr:MAG: hypothetical protein EU550_00090 [Candidatus Lokiarchaeota archaeon]